MNETGAGRDRLPDPFADPAPDGRRAGGESRHETAGAQDNVGASDEPTGKEVLCTICGLRACWQ